MKTSDIHRIINDRTVVVRASDERAPFVLLIYVDVHFASSNLRSERRAAIHCTVVHVVYLPTASYQTTQIDCDCRYMARISV